MADRGSRRFGGIATSEMMAARNTGKSSTKARRVGVIDFLAMSFDGCEGIEKDGSTFTLRRPWALARFRFALRAGWWCFECSGDDDNSTVEARLSAPSDPLIVLRAKDSNDVRIRITGRAERDISLLFSAWPARMTFSSLKLRRLSSRELQGLLVETAKDLATRKRPLSAVSSVLKRIGSNQAIGVRVGGAAPSATPIHAETEMRSSAPCSTRETFRDGRLEMLTYTGDLIHPDAWTIVAAEFDRRPELVAIYSDVDVRNRIIPHPRWDPELAKLFPYSDAPFFFRAGKHDLPNDPELRVAELMSRFGRGAIDRIALPLVQRSSASSLTFSEPSLPSFENIPRVSVVIPTKHRADLFERCLEGLKERTAYEKLDVIVVDNGTSGEHYPRIIERYSKHLDLRVVVDQGRFNFSRLINRGAENAEGDVLLLLNDDVTALQQGWLHRMVDSVIRKDIGVVGARLVYPDGTVQHAGVALGITGISGHLWKGLAKEHADTNPYVSLPSSRLAVTGACLAVRRDVFESVAGFDERFPVAFNDIDFCLRLQAAGYRILYRGDAILMHDESQSRGSDDVSVETRRRLASETQAFLERWAMRLEDDPYSSPAFNPVVESGEVHGAAFSRKPYRSI